MKQLEEDVRQALNKLGLAKVPEVSYNLNPAVLITEAIQNGEAVFSSSGALVVNTSPYTGRSPNDKYIVANSDPDIWFAKGTQEISVENYQKLKAKLLAYLQDKKLYVRDMRAGADEKTTRTVRVITEQSWQNLFASSLLVTAIGSLPYPDPDFTVIATTGFTTDPKEYGLRSKAFIIMDFLEKLVLIGSSTYAGEIKKSVFTYMNYVLPKQDILSLHCSANKGVAGDVALFFGLSGTGKTTLSSDPDRALIGDDEHGWSEDGVFNFEGGCYAKTIRINPNFEPLVWSAINRFGCLLENVPLVEGNMPDFNSDKITENTRAAYPLAFIPNFEPSGTGGHPSHIFFLTADAFGVMPPLAKLTNEQAMYYFLSGYTSKLAGTERGIGDKPEAIFSTCFGAPFLPLKPSIYANLLSKKLAKHGTKVWLLNTGWSGGGFGTGKRIALPLTRAMISAVLTNQLNEVPTHLHPIFNVAIPDHVPGVPENILNPELSWSDQQAYELEARNLAKQFHDNFKTYASSVSEKVNLAGPKLVG